MTGSIHSSFARRARDAVLGVEGVSDLNAGVLQEIGTYLPGDRVPGVRVADDGVHVHIVIEASAVEHIPAVAGRTRRAVRRVLDDDGLPDPPEVHVHVDDVDELFLPVHDDVQDDPVPGTRKEES